MKTITKTCDYCKNTFEAPLRDTKRGRARFCSLRCSAYYNGEIRARSTVLNCECAYCGKLFHKSTSRLSKSRSGLVFCCREHKDFGQRIENGLMKIHPPHYGTGKRDYRELALRHLEAKCVRCGYDKIKNVLHVHHKDRNRKNNVLENLEVLCPTCHEEEHFLSHDGRWSSPN